VRWSADGSGKESASSELQREACRLKAEGIICKQADQPYRPGRSSAWLKVKCSDARSSWCSAGCHPVDHMGIGSLALAYYDHTGQLHYAGAVGSGFTDKELVSLRERLDGLPVTHPPGILVAGDAPDRQIRWVRPELVAEVGFTAWSGDGRARHAVYLGLREDKAAKWSWP
jgi:bifunctional non-homologous end joining protein LigD